MVLITFSPAFPVPRPKVTDIKFHGNLNYSQNRLRKLMGTSRSTLFKSKPLYSDMLLTDLKNIVDFYHLHGFDEAEIADLTIDWNEDSSSVVIEIEISEGEPVIIHSIEIAGVSIIAPDSLKRKIGCREGVRLDYEEISRVEKRLLRFYGDKGYLSVSASHEISIQGKDADIIYLVNEGYPAYLNRLILAGGKRIENWVIEREFHINPGDIISISELEAANDRLFSLGLFKQVSIETESTAIDTLKNIIVTIEEKPPGEISFGGGYGSFEGARAICNFNYVNLFHRRSSVGFEGKISPKNESVKVQFHEPYFLKSGIFFYSTLGWNREEEPSYTSENAAFQVRWGSFFRDKNQVQWGYSFHHYTLSDIAPGIDVEDSTGDISRFEVEFNFDYRDQRINSSQGFLINQLIQVSEPYIIGKVGFVKSTSEIRVFRRAFPWLTLAFQGKVGTIISSGSTIIPLTEKFLLGGRDDVRGYSRHSLGPVNIGGAPTGGKFLLLGRAEFRLHLYKYMGLDIFADNGALFRKYNSSRWDGVRSGAGAGLRISYSVWTASAQYAWRVHQGIKPGGYYFNVGHSF